MIWLFLKILNDILLRIQKEKDTWLLFNGWSRRFKIIKHCEVE